MCTQNTQKYVRIIVYAKMQKIHAKIRTHKNNIAYTENSRLNANSR